jgi:uncharacterized lipoprotein YddW (UPF0748 family)
MGKILIMISLYLLAGSICTANIQNWNVIRSLSQGKAEVITAKGHGKVLSLNTPKASSKLCIQNSSAINVKPGENYILGFDAKSNFSEKYQTRAGVFFFDANSKRLTKGSIIKCGGSPDWKHYSLKIIVPQGAATMHLIALNYMAEGESYFDNFVLKTSDTEVVKIANADFEKVITTPEVNKNTATPPEYIWEFKVKVPEYNINAKAYIMDVKINPDLVHYDGPQSIKYLTGKGSAQFSAPAPVYLSTNPGTSYWRFINLTNLTQTFAWSEEKIKMDSGKRVNFEIPFTKRFNSYLDPFCKGPYMIRGHHYFSIYENNGKKIGTARENVFSSQISPEASFMGNARVSQTKTFRNTMFTLADLSGKFKISINDFRSSGKAGEWFAFKLILTDTVGQKLPVNRISSLKVSDGENELDCQMLFDRWDVPQGYFIGKYANHMSEEIVINAAIKASTPDGNKIFKLQESFSTAAVGKKPEIPTPPHAPAKEWRMIMANPSIFSKDPKTGPEQIKEMVLKAKKNNFNMIIAFVMGNRCWMPSPLATNPYFKVTHNKYDVFAELRKNCKDTNIKLGGVVCLLPEGVEKLKGILVEHPEWAMRNSKGLPMGWLDPAVPEARAYRVKDIVEAARKYKLDDISLDYGRLSSGPSDRGAEIYRKEFGKDPRTFKFESPDYIHWFKWTSKHLTQMVKEVREALKKECPNTELSAYVQGYKFSGDTAWFDNHQPSRDWVKNGYMDIIYSTGYVYDMLQYKSWCKRQIDLFKKANPDVPCIITIGVGSSHGRLETFEELLYQINTITELGGDGAAFFRWVSLEKWADRLGKERYAKPAPLD